MADLLEAEPLIPLVTCGNCEVSDFLGRRSRFNPSLLSNVPNTFRKKRHSSHENPQRTKTLRDFRELSGFSSESHFKPGILDILMSLITMIVISGGRMSVSELHYRHVIEILASSFSCIDALVYEAPHPAVLDAGYILIDVDSKIIVSRQDAFSLHHLPKKLKDHIQREWVVT